MGRGDLRLAAALASAAGRAAAASVVFHPPTLVQTGDDPHDPASGGMGLFYALNDTHLFGQEDVLSAVGRCPLAGRKPASWRSTGATMYYSSDSGASWAKAGEAPAPVVAGSYEPIPGPAPHTLQNFGVLPYEWPSTPPPWRSFTSPNTTTFSVSPAGQLQWSTDSSRSVTFSGFPAGVGPCRNQHLEPNGWRLQGTAHVVTSDGGILQTVIACVGGSKHGTVAGTVNTTSILAFRSECAPLSSRCYGSLMRVVTRRDGGRTFVYQSAIANATHYPDSGEGPNEHALTYLKDGSTILCILRAYGDRPCNEPGCERGPLCPEPACAQSR